MSKAKAEGKKTSVKLAAAAKNVKSDEALRARQLELIQTQLQGGARTLNYLKGLRINPLPLERVWEMEAQAAFIDAELQEGRVTWTLVQDAFDWSTRVMRESGLQLADQVVHLVGRVRGLGRSPKGDLVARAAEAATVLESSPDQAPQGRQARDSWRKGILDARRRLFGVRDELKTLIADAKAAAAAPKPAPRPQNQAERRARQLARSQAGPKGMAGTAGSKFGGGSSKSARRKAAKRARRGA